MPLLALRCLVLLFTVAPAFATVRLHPLFSDHAVLQTEVPLPVWGRGEPGERVFVRLDEQMQSATVDSNGAWKVMMPPITRPGPIDFTVVGDRTTETILVNDVVAGEVWLGSGQSNMDMRVGGGIPDTERYWCGVERQAEEIAAAKFPLIRMFLQEVVMSDVLLAEPAGKWVVCSPETAGDFSATGYFFARDLHRTLGRPVGLVLSCYGASTIEAWMSQPALEKTSAGPKALQHYTKAVAEFGAPEAQIKYEEALAKWEGAAAKAKLAGKRGPRRPKNPHQDQHNPCVLFNGMISPITGFPVRGVVWYQGESNLGQAAHYAEWMEALIADWRLRWNAPELPFLYVQLANYKERTEDPAARTQIAPLRAAQTAALRVPHTGMAVAIDLGDAKDIHPKNKQDVGLRLALIARAKVYGETNLAYSGPMLVSAKAEGTTVRLEFAHTEQGLVAKGSELKGFAMAGSDGAFKWAKASIDGNTVTVSSHEVPEPRQVRYAWADNPESTLYNGAGLPCVPFAATVAR